MEELIRTFKCVYLKLVKNSRMQIVTLSIIFIIGLSLRLWNINYLGLFYDEAIFAYVASDILRGKIIYRDIVDNKMPYFYYTIALIFFLFGKSIVYPRFFSAFLSTLTLIFVYLIGKELYDKKVGLFSAGIYALDPLSIFWSRYAMTEPYMTFFTTFAIYMYVLHLNNKKTTYLFLAGSLTGVSIFMKQPGIITFLVIVVCIFIDSFRKDVSNKKNIILMRVFISLMGVITAILPVLTYFWLNNAFGNFVQWGFLIPLQYKASYPLLVRFTVLYIVLNYNVLIWILGLSSILLTLKRRKKADLIILSCFLMPFVTLASLPYFFDHYFLQVIPFLSILSGIFLSELISFTKQLQMREFLYGKNILRFMIIGIILIPYAHSFPLIFYSYTGEPLFDPDRSLILEKKVGDYLEAHTLASEKIFSDLPKYVFLANRETL